MRRIAQRLRAIKPKRAALLLAVAAFAATACFGGREASVGDSTVASGEGGTPEPLTLTLTAASQICETEQAIEYGGARQWEDEDGNWQIERYSDGWDNVSETPVTWAVSGGTPPYTLTIDGETRDEKQTYAGASGTASVSCALEFGETFIHDNEQRRNYRTQPEVDSGLKTIRATATDSAGATADASVNVHVILKLPGSGSILERGKTYRVFGHLITAPADYDVRVGSVTEPNCSEAPPEEPCGPEFRLHLVGTNAYLSLFMDNGAEGIRRYPHRATVLESALGALMDSVGRLPTVESPAP